MYGNANGDVVDFFIGDVGGEVTIDVFSRSAIFNFA